MGFWVPCVEFFMFVKMLYAQHSFVHHATTQHFLSSTKGQTTRFKISRVKYLKKFMMVAESHDDSLLLSRNFCRLKLIHVIWKVLGTRKYQTVDESWNRRTIKFPRKLKSFAWNSRRSKWKIEFDDFTLIYSTFLFDFVSQDLSIRFIIIYFIISVVRRTFISLCVRGKSRHRSELGDETKLDFPIKNIQYKSFKGFFAFKNVDRKILQLCNKKWNVSLWFFLSFGCCLPQATPTRFISDPCMFILAQQ